MSTPNIQWGESGVTISGTTINSGTLTVSGDLTAQSNIIVGSSSDPTIELNSDGSSTFTGKMTINNNNNDSETAIFVVGSSSNEASITNKGNASFNNSVSAQTIHALSSLRLINTTVNSITTSATESPNTTSNTSIPTVGYLTKAISANGTTFTKPFQITSTTGDEESNPTYSYQIVMWFKINENTENNAKYFGKKYSYTSDGVFSETAVTGTGTYPWTN